LALFLVVLSVAVVTVPFAYADDISNTTWWVGMGARQNMFVKYHIQQVGTSNDAHPFNMTIYFEKRDEKLGIWIAPTLIESNGTSMINGTLWLTSDLAVLNAGGYGVPSDMNPYLHAYDNSLRWISALLPQNSPRTLGSDLLTKAQCLIPGCRPDIIHVGMENLTVPAGVFNTIVLVTPWGQNNNTIWITKDLPYPVKGLFQSPTTSSSSSDPISFELIAVGNGKPLTMPEFPQEIPIMPLASVVAVVALSLRLRWLSTSSSSV
jgi:hypothetical protein